MFKFSGSVTDTARRLCSKSALPHLSTRGLKTKPTKCEIFSLVTSLKNADRQFKHLSKNFSPGSKHQRKLNLSFWLHSSAQNHKQSHWKKIIELEIVDGIVEKLDAHNGFLMLKNCYSLPKLLYFLKIPTCFNHPALLKKYGKTVPDGLSKVCNVNFDDISST